jgi:hypothetical protein
MLESFRADITPPEKKLLISRVDAAMHRQLERIMERQIEDKLRIDAALAKPPKENRENEMANEIKVVMRFNALK